MNTPMPSLHFSVLLLQLFFFFLSVVPRPSFSAQEKCHQEDKEVLLRIKKALNDPYMLASWDTDSDCCRWYCVKCHLTTHRISELTIGQGSLPGQIPAAIGDLPHLEMLVLHKLPDLSGPIPTSITKLSYLKHLDISSINLTGPIPHFISSLKNLNLLDLSFNKLTGRIPSSLSQIPSLRYIGLDRNQLTGTIPASLANLRANNLYLILSHNQLSGPIPASLGEINFGQIDFSRNKLNGDISMLFGAQKTTEIMDFSRNLFEFNLSELKVQPKLRYLDLNHNKIYGSIPKEFMNLELQRLNVSYNRLCGEIPKGGSLQRFDYSSYFHNPCLCGAPLRLTCK